MTRWFVSRHPGAVEWIRSTGVKVDEFRDHLNIEDIEMGDIVMGVLPMSVAAAVCAKGARFIGMEISQSREMRGKELQVQDLKDLNCRLQEFFVTPLEEEPELPVRSEAGRNTKS